jgi:hypothetical protein
MKPVAGSTWMKPVLHEAVRCEYDRGVANCPVKTVSSVAPRAELVLDLMTISVNYLDVSVTWVCVNRLDFAAEAVASRTLGARPESRDNLPQDLIE